MSAAVERIPIIDRPSWLAMRQRDVTASVVGALLGVHEYETPYGLWALKTGRVAEEDGETGPMRRGRLLEEVAVKALREERPSWTVEPGGFYVRDPSARLGATPDVVVQDPDRGPGIVQIKSVEPNIFRRKWRDDAGEVELPLWIAVQAITEAHLTGSSWAAVGALVIGHGVDLELVDVPIHAGVIDRIRSAVASFWDLVESGRTPEPDFGRDAELIERLYRGDEAADPADLSADNMMPSLLDERARLSAEKRNAEGRLREINAELLHKLGTATSGRISDGRLVSASIINRKAYSVAASSYRQIRVKGEAA